MSYVYKVFNYNSLGNINVEGDPGLLSLINVLPGYTSSSLIAEGNLFGDSYRLVVTGNFDVSKPLHTLADLKGSISSSTSYKNGFLSEIHEIDPPLFASLVKLGTFVPEFYLGDDWFEASSTNSLSDVITGLSGNDVFIGYGSGENGIPKDYFYAGDGIDTSVYRGAFSEYTISFNEEIWDDRVANGSRVPGICVDDLVRGRDGSDALNDVERLQFSNTNLALDIDLWDNAGSAYRLYKAAFDREPDEVGLGYWIDQLDNGGSLQLAASGFLISDEFRSLYGSNPSDTLFLTRLYNNVLDRDPDQGGLNYWISQINNGMSRESALINFSESNENVSNVAALIDNGIQYQPWLG
jgi:Domain of unknown function (DUF4214)